MSLLRQNRAGEPDGTAVSRRGFLRGAGVLGVGGALSVSAAAPAAGHAPAAATDRPFEIATVVRVRRRTIVARLRGTGRTVTARPTHFDRNWRLQRGDDVAIERWRGDLIAVPFVGVYTDTRMRTTRRSVKVAGRRAMVDTQSASRMVSRARRRLRRGGARRVVAGFVRNRNTGQLRCLGVRADD